MTIIVSVRYMFFKVVQQSKVNKQVPLQSKYKDNHRYIANTLTYLPSCRHASLSIAKCVLIVLKAR